MVYYNQDKGRDIRKEIRVMKELNQFYKENIEIIRELEDRLFDFSEQRDEECGKQSMDKDYVNKAWSALYELRIKLGDVSE